MEEEIMIVAIVGTLTLGVMIISIFALISRAISRRGASRKELQELRQDMSQIKSNIEEMREHLADIIIRLG